MDQWKRTGFKIRGFKNPIVPHLWETSVDPVVNFSTETKIISSGWVEILQYRQPLGYISHSQIECMCDIQHIKPSEKNNIAPLLIASVDGEMYSPNHRQFPNALKKNNPVIVIAVSLNRTNSKEIEKYCHNLLPVWIIIL
jgi:hypothetical protein